MRSSERARRRPLVTAVVLSVPMVAGACSSAEPAGGSAGSAGTCPTEPVAIVVSVDPWRDLVSTLAGDCGDVTTVAAGSVDPHDFEPTPGDVAEFAGADVVVVNGLGYDRWAEDAVDHTGGDPAVVDAGAVAGLDGGANPHLWYGRDYVDEVAAAVTSQLKVLRPEAAAYFDERASAWRASLRPYHEAIAELRTTAAGQAYGATEPVFAYLGDALGLTDATPEGYRNAAANEAEPGPGDLAAFLRLVDEGAVRVLIDNPQTQGSAPDQIRRAAETAGVPVVEMTETPPDSTGFVAWQVAQLDDLAEALGSAP